MVSDPHNPHSQKSDTISSGIKLKCGVHLCPQKCHQLFDHSKIICRAVLQQKCSKGHNQLWPCHAGAPLLCEKCKRETKEAEKKAQKDLEAKQRKDEKIAKVEEEMEKISLSMQDARLEMEQQQMLEQKREDLAVCASTITFLKTALYNRSTVLSFHACRAFIICTCPVAENKCEAVRRIALIENLPGR